MKKCPCCKDISSYGDWEELCPVCNSKLVAILTNNSEHSNSDVVYQESVRNVNPLNETIQNTINETVSIEESTTPVFENDGTYRGRITFVHSQARYSNRFKKIVNAIFRGEPFQFGNTSHETHFRLSEFAPGHIVARERNFVFYGDVEGRFDQGDDVTVSAKRHGDRYVVTRFYSNSTEGYVRPRPQIPSWIIRFVFAVSIVFLIALIVSGQAMNLLVYAILIIGLLAIIRRRGWFRRH